MGRFRDFLTGANPVTEFASQEKNLTFDAGLDIDPALLYGINPAPTVILPARVSRREALSVPAVKRARDLICGTLGSLPLNLIGPDMAGQDWSLFGQPERDTPRSISMSMVAEDLLFESVSWWRIVSVGWHNKPVEVVRLDPRTVNIRRDQRVFVSRDGTYTQGTAEEWVPDDQLIRFDGPNDPLLVVGARAIRAALSLDAAALRHAEGAPPLDYFTPSDGFDPADDADVVALLDAWKVARQTRSTAYIPANLQYNLAGWNPEQLQMAEARNHAVLEIARLTGIDPEELGVSTTSRTYANQFDRRKAFLDFTVGPFRAAIEDRLSMNDVSPRGYKARFDLSDFLRSDDLTRMQVYAAGKPVGAWTDDEIRANEHKAPLNAEEKAALQPAAPATPAPIEEPAHA